MEGLIVMAGPSVRITRLKFHYEGFDAVRKSPEVRAELLRRGQAIAAAAESNGGGTIHVNESEGKSRARVTVVTGDYQAMKSEAENRSLSRSLDAGRG